MPDTHEDILIEVDGNLGDIQVVIIGNEKSWQRSWFIKYIEIYQHLFDKVKRVIFPCYHWIGSNDSVSITSSTSKLY